MNVAWIVLTVTAAREDSDIVVLRRSALRLRVGCAAPCKNGHDDAGLSCVIMAVGSYISFAAGSGTCARRGRDGLSEERFGQLGLEHMAVDIYQAEIAHLVAPIGIADVKLAEGVHQVGNPAGRG